mgnify:CR=1 FL=1
MSPRDLWFGVFKITALLTFGLIFFAYVISELLIDDSPFSGIGFVALLLALAVNILASGLLAILKIIDWFEKRRLKREAEHG